MIVQATQHDNPGASPLSASFIHHPVHPVHPVYPVTIVSEPAALQNTRQSRQGFVGCPLPARLLHWPHRIRPTPGRRHAPSGVKNDLRSSNLRPQTRRRPPGRRSLCRGAASPRKIFAHRRLLAHRDRPPEPDHPRLGLRERRRAQPHPRRGWQGPQLAAQDHPRQHPQHELRDLEPRAVHAAHGVAIRPWATSTKCASIPTRTARCRNCCAAGKIPCPIAKSSRRWPPACTPSSAT